LKWFSGSRGTIESLPRFTAYDEPKEIKIMNVLGDELKLRKLQDFLRFTLNGQKFELRPVIEDEKKHFIIFRDLTAGKTKRIRQVVSCMQIYPKERKVVLDFNRAENPPCAFTEFATCPLPPRQNFMNISINAGERTYHKK
jgi:uncharacterized protein (DUF1684 family)